MTATPQDPTPAAPLAGPLSEGERAIDALMNQSHISAPHELPALIAVHAAALGLDDAVAYLVDLQQAVLIPFLGSSGPGVERQRDPLAVDSTLAGRAFQLTEVLTQPLEHPPGAVRVWAPILDGTERLGVLGATIADADLLTAGDGALGRRLRRLAAIVAELVMSKTMYGDTIVRLRRRARLSLAAEMQWGLLPPLTFACQGLIICGALEPAYQVAGDSVDYAVDEGYARFAIFDGMGHGLHSAQLAALTVAAYRTARRAEKSLTQTARDVDAAVSGVHAGQAFATGVLAELNTDTGMLSWISAGHPEPLLLRDGRLVRALETEPALPFGLHGDLRPASGYAVGSEQLQPGDRVVLYTDGVTDARSPGGQEFGVETLVDLLGRNTDERLPAPESMRRLVRSLLAHTEGPTTDDATLLLAEWRSGQERILLP